LQPFPARLMLCLLKRRAYIQTHITDTRNNSPAGHLCRPDLHITSVSFCGRVKKIYLTTSLLKLPCCPFSKWVAYLLILSNCGYNSWQTDPLYTIWSSWNAYSFSRSTLIVVITSKDEACRQLIYRSHLREFQVTPSGRRGVLDTCKFVSTFHIPAFPRKWSIRFWVHAFIHLSKIYF
jgi:hypothetical protein